MKPVHSDAFSQKTIQWGYWGGGFACVLALFSLALGLSPLLTSLKKNLIMTSCPGTQTLDLKSPGLYMGIGLSKDMPEADVQAYMASEFPAMTAMLQGLPQM